jgi:hypothetical protein
MALPCCDWTICPDCVGRPSFPSKAEEGVKGELRCLGVSPELVAMKLIACFMWCAN